MGGAEAYGRPKRTGAARAGIVVLRLVSALVAVASVWALAADLAGKASSPAPAEPEVEAPAAEADDEERRRAQPGALVHEGDPTVYDSQADLERCGRWRGSMEPSSSAPGLDDDVRTISARVERLRRLDFERAVDTRLVPRSEVGERFARGFLRNYGARDAERDAAVLAALRLVPEGTDLRALTARLLGQGVAGFYNPRKDRLFAGSTGGELTAYDEMVLAHELDHALVDQVLRLPGTISRDPMLGDVMLARQALGEGDATLVMTRYAAGRFTEPELTSFLARFSQRQVQPRADVPYVFARTSEFPYYEGLLFVCAEWRARGWGAVDEMYLRPPVTTADVLFPFRYYEDDEAELPPGPSSPGGSWGPRRGASFGALDVMVLLENADLLSTGETVPGSHVDAVRGWDGGVLSAWFRGDDVTIHVGLVDAGVETESGRRRRLCGVMRRWYLESFPGVSETRARVAGAKAWKGEGGVGIVRCRRDHVELVTSPSGRAARRILRG